MKIWNGWDFARFQFSQISNKLYLSFLKRDDNSQHSNVFHFRSLSKSYLLCCEHFTDTEQSKYFGYYSKIQKSLSPDYIVVFQLYKACKHGVVCTHTSEIYGAFQMNEISKHGITTAAYIITRMEEIGTTQSC